MLRRLWGIWLLVARKIGYIQAWLILVLMYFVVIAPFALVVRLFQDPLTLRRRTSWHWFSEDERPIPTSDRVKRQF